MNQMPFKRLCTGKVLAFRFQFPSCHNHRPYDPKDTPAARVFDPASVQSLDPTHHRVPSSLASAPRPSGCHREPLLVLVDVAPQCTVRGQPSQIVVMGRLVSIGICDWSASRQDHRPPSADWPELPSVCGNKLSSPTHPCRLSVWQTAGDTLSRISIRRARDCSDCLFQRSDIAEKAILFTDQESPYPDLR